MTVLSVEGADYYRIAREHVENGKLYAGSYNTSFFGMGYEAWQLGQLVETPEGPRELWSLIAPADMTMSYFLSDAWNVPYSSLMNAKSIIEFYHVLLGWDLAEMERIGRTKLSAAKAWLARLLSSNMVDNVLVTMLRDGTDTQEIEDYLKVAKEEYNAQIQAPLLPKLGRMGENLLRVSAISTVKPREEDEEDIEDAEDDKETDWEEGSEEEEEDTGSDVVEEAFNAARELAKYDKLRGPLQVQMGKTGDPLHKYILRMLSNHNLPEEERILIEEELRLRLEGYEQYPLMVYEDGIPIPVGMLVISGTLEESIAERVISGLQRQFSGKR
jgi:hypothetical protein